MKPKNEKYNYNQTGQIDKENNKFERISQLNEKFIRKDNKYLKTFLDVPKK